MSAERKESAGGLPVPVVVALVFLLVGGTVVYFLYQRAKNRTPDVPVLTQDAAAYLPHLQLSDVDMKAAENYLGHTSTSITGKVTNTGPRTLQLVEIRCVFKDYAGQVVARERVAVVGRKTGLVPTGQTRLFELAFDNIPSTWNQALPDLVISQIIFQE